MTEHPPAAFVAPAVRPAGPPVEPHPGLPSILGVSGLGKSYRGARALAGLSFEIGAGEVLGLLGPNGAGKSTAIECVAGLLTSDEGVITLCGEPVTRAARRRIGTALQGTLLPDHITVREALALFARLYGAEADIDGLLARFGLADRAASRFLTLSGGLRQRLALALAVVNAPLLVLLDEPTAALDIDARREVHRLIGKMAADGCAILLATHDMNEAQLLCDRVVILHRGAVIAEGPPDALPGMRGAGTVIAGRASIALDRTLLPPLAGLEVTGEWFRCRSASPHDDAAALLAAIAAQGGEIVALRLGKPELEHAIGALLPGWTDWVSAAP